MCVCVCVLLKCYEAIEISGELVIRLVAKDTKQYEKMRCSGRFIVSRSSQNRYQEFRPQRYFSFSSIPPCFLETD